MKILSLLTTLAVLLLMPVPPLPDIPHLDVYAHVLLFTALTALAPRLWYIILLAGVTLEAVQPLVGRGFQPHDIAANTAGIILGKVLTTSRTP